VAFAVAAKRALVVEVAAPAGGPVSVELSVIVPCFNEEGNLPELVERTERVFDRRGIAGEVVLVNDGSTDGTRAQIDALAATHARVVPVHHPVNRGIPAGWKSGLEHSHGRYLCTIDADLQYQPEAIAQLYREMCFSRADMVQGWRSSLERHRYDIRYYMSRGLDHLLKLVFAMPGYDVKSGFVIYKREVFEDILQDAGAYHYFQHMMTVVARARGYSIRQVETLFEERRAGRSFIGRLPLAMIARTLVDIGRAVVALRLREPKDPSLAVALGARPGPSRPEPAGWRRRSVRVYRALMPVHHRMLSHNAPRYLDELRRTQWLSGEEIAQLQLRRLRRLVDHAADHVGYWRETFQAAGIGPGDIRTLDDLRRIPLLTKQELRENIYFDLLSDNNDKRKIEKMVTSGSTGEPLALFVDRLQLDMRWATAVRAAEWAGTRCGDRQLVLWRTTAGGAPGRVRERLDALLLRRKRMAAFPLDEDAARRCVDYVRRRRPALVAGDAEALAALAHLLDGGPGAGAGAVVSFGQTLLPGARALIEACFGARLFDGYGAREFGTIAHECEAHAGYHVNAESFIVEVLRDGRPVGEGEVGEVVVTDLNNRCVPLLRYRLGDVAVATDRRCPCGRGLPLLARVSGRRPAGVLGARGRFVPATFFAHLFKDYEYAVLGYQVVQEVPDRVDVRIVRRSRFSSDTEDAIRRALTAVLGAEMTLRFEFPGAIPPGHDGKVHPCLCLLPLPGVTGAEAPAPEGEDRRAAR